MGTAAGFPGDNNQVAEDIVSGEFQELAIFSLADHDFAMFAGGDFEMLDRIAVDVPLPRGPGQTAFDRSQVVPSGCLRE